MKRGVSTLRAGAAARRAAFSTLLFLLFTTSALAQRGDTYYFSIGPALTAGSEWGEGHKAGYALEVGLIRPLSRRWDLVGALGYEQFEIGRPTFEPYFPTDSQGSWGPIRGGEDFVASIRGGTRYNVATTTRLKPYVGASLSLAFARQDEASGVVVDQIGRELERRTLQQGNSQLALGMSTVFGVRGQGGLLERLFLEAGYTFVFTPDDSFDDNPSFFPIRVGITF